MWFVELAPLDRAELVGEAVAAAFGLPVRRGTTGHGRDRSIFEIEARAPHPATTANT